MIESGEKKEEYREIKPYWVKRLIGCDNECEGYNILNGEILCPICRFEKYKRFNKVVFSYGYTKRRMTFEIKIISTGIGKPEWGAIEGENYFVIKLGKRIN